MVEVEWTRRALRDLNDIAEYIARDSPRTAQWYVKAVSLDRIS